MNVYIDYDAISFLSVT